MLWFTFEIGAASHTRGERQKDCPVGKRDAETHGRNEEAGGDADPKGGGREGDGSHSSGGHGGGMTKKRKSFQIVIFFLTILSKKMIIILFLGNVDGDGAEQSKGVQDGVHVQIRGDSHGKEVEKVLLFHKKQFPCMVPRSKRGQTPRNYRFGRLQSREK